MRAASSSSMRLPGCKITQHAFRTTSRKQFHHRLHKENDARMLYILWEGMVCQDQSRRVCSAVYVFRPVLQCHPCLQLLLPKVFPKREGLSKPLMHSAMQGDVTQSWSSPIIKAWKYHKAHISLRNDLPAPFLLTHLAPIDPTIALSSSE